MKAVVQRVSRAEVRVDSKPTGAIGTGLLVLLGVADGDTDADARALAGKIAKLRIFPSEHRPIDRSVTDAGGEALVVSQFTLLGDTRKGNRPSFVAAACPLEAEHLYCVFCVALKDAGIHVATGVFGAMMEVELVNDGPVTIVL